MSNLKSQISNLKLLGAGYLLTILSLFFYSFTQVDLNLTLSQASWWQAVQKFFQHIGYFDRPLSSLLYTILILLMFFFYILFIKLAQKNKIDTKKLWILIIIVTGILTFSYNAFSYDLFNYIFDAKIITFYHQNPYLHKALDYPLDPMVNFMRWTHRAYPYGPSWLFLTVPLSYLGFNLFLPTFFIFKIFNSLCFVGTAYFIGKILKKLKKNYTFGVVLFALNPLTIIESLVSSHNDIAMIFIAMLSIYLLLLDKKILSIATLILSIGVKFATIFMLPAYIYYFLKSKSSKFSPDFFLSILFISMFFAVVVVTLRTNFQPWYLLNIIPFASLLSNKKIAIGTCLVLPFFALLQYLPFLYNGNWNSPAPLILLWLTILGSACYAIYLVINLGSLKLFNLSRK